MLVAVLSAKKRQSDRLAASLASFHLSDSPAKTAPVADAEKKTGDAPSTDVEKSGAGGDKKKAGKKVKSLNDIDGDSSSSSDEEDDEDDYESCDADEEMDVHFRLEGLQEVSQGACAMLVIACGLIAVSLSLPPCVCWW